MHARKGSVRMDSDADSEPVTPVQLLLVISKLGSFLQLNSWQGPPLSRKSAAHSNGPKEQDFQGWKAFAKESGRVPIMTVF